MRPRVSCSESCVGPGTRSRATTSGGGPLRHPSDDRGGCGADCGWRYPGAYSFYDADQDAEDLAELLDPAGWGREYFSVDDRSGELVGFLVFKAVGGDTDVGLGLRPDLTGRGLGGSVLEAALSFGTRTLGAERYALRVAAFNRRAISVYERAGFREVERFEHFSAGAVHTFVRMVREPDG